MTDPEDTSGVVVSDLSACEARGQTLGFQTGLNVHQPLQLGGINGQLTSSPSFTQKSFEGCVKNVIFNGNMYDMGSPGYAKDSQIGCEPSDNQCGAGTSSFPIHNIPHCAPANCFFFGRSPNLFFWSVNSPNFYLFITTRCGVVLRGK